jgi:hypothetical protein
MPRLRRRCKHCREVVTVDVYGELAHEENNLYGCEGGETVAE